MSFWNEVDGYARRASSALGIPVEVILAQWQVESAGGTSRLARQANNLGGIKYSKNSIASGQDGAFAKYENLSQFTDDYIRVMNLGYYTNVRSAGGVEKAVQALADSPYDAGHYGGGGKSLLDIINKQVGKDYTQSGGDWELGYDPGGYDYTTTAGGGEGGFSLGLDFFGGLERFFSKWLIVALLIVLGVLVFNKTIS